MSNLDYITQLVDDEARNVNDVVSLEKIRAKFLGKKGLLTEQLNQLVNMPLAERITMGETLNLVKRNVQEVFKSRYEMIVLNELNRQLDVDKLDVTLPGRYSERGAIHPVIRTINRIEQLFSSMGFSRVQGPEIEDGFHCFDSLNMPIHHPARDEQDTFYFEPTMMLRPHTSSVQIRTMQQQQPPIRIIAPGRVYRNDYDMTHTPMFHQVEGLLVDEHASFTELKGILHDFLRNYFEEDLTIRFRPSYFPFTEPSAEVDVMGKNGKWLEVLGCGMVHPNVLRSVGIDPEKYSGFAFGMGVERLTMLRYGVNDLRAFFENDLRFLKQFK